MFSWRIMVSSHRPSMIHHKLCYECSNHSVTGAQQVRNSFNNLWTFYVARFQTFSEGFLDGTNRDIRFFFFKNHNEQAHTDQTTTNAGS